MDDFSILDVIVYKGGNQKVLEIAQKGISYIN